MSGRLPSADWSDTGYWTRLTPNPGNSLAFIVWIAVLVASWYNNTDSRLRARGACRVSPLLSLAPSCTRARARARNRVLHASLALAERSAERAGIARWERNSVLSDKQLPPSGLIAAN